MVGCRNANLIAVFVCPPFIVGSVLVRRCAQRIHRGPRPAPGRDDRSSARQEWKGWFVANKSDLYAGSHEQAGQRISKEERAADAGAKTKFKTFVTATMKRRALKPKKSKAERSR